MLVTSIYSFSQNVFNPIKGKNHHFCYFYSANAFNLDKFKNLSFDKELNPIYTEHGSLFIFQTPPDDNSFLDD